MNLDYLDPKILKLTNRIVRGGVNFLSGTMAPAKSNPEHNNIESLKLGLEHYAKRGVESVIIQPKYMGSRCQVYVHHKLEDCYAVSRNGFKIDHVDLKDVFKERHDHWFGEDKISEGIKLVIEDGELMPWSVLGKGLIEGPFGLFESCSYKEKVGLASLGFYDRVDKQIEKLSKEDELDDRAVKLGEALMGINFVEETKELEDFSFQLRLFGESGDPYFKPFNILKVVYDNGGEDILMDDNCMNYLEVSDDDFILMDPTDKLNRALHEFMADIESQQLEGVVIKPACYEYQEDREKRCAPYLKVRNPEYLRLVYGPDYTRPEKLEKLVQKKMIGRKLGASIKEYEIGRQLLEIPVGLLDSSNEHYKELVAKALLQFKQDEQLDPRL